MIKKSRQFPVKVLTLVFLLVLSCMGTIPSFAGTDIQSVETITAALGDQSLPPAVWRYDGRVKPDSTSGYHPFDFDGTTLTLYWEQVLDGLTPVSTYEIYRAREKSGADWSDPAAWGGEPILKVNSPEVYQANWKTYAKCSAESLLAYLDPGREYVYGVRAVSGNKTSGISKIPYPFRAPGSSLVGLAQFYLTPGLFTDGKYALEIVFSGSASRDKAVIVANYNVIFNKSQVVMKGPDRGKAFFDPVRNSVIMDTDINNSEPPEELSITVKNITGSGGLPMNTAQGGPTNFISDNISKHIIRESSRELGVVIPVNPISGQRSEYIFSLPVKESLPSGGRVVISFPSEYTIDGSISAPDTSSRPVDMNGDVNGGNNDKKVKISGVQVYPGSNMVILTLSEQINSGEVLAFILDNITNPHTASLPGQAYLFSVKAPAGSTSPSILPAFVSAAGEGSPTITTASAGLAAGELKAIRVTVQNLPPDINSKVVVFANGVNQYDQSIKPVEISNGGKTRVYQLSVRVPGQYAIGVYPYDPQAVSARIMAPPAFLTPAPKSLYVTDNTSVSMILPSQSMLTDVVVEMKDVNGKIPGNGKVYAYSPTNPEVFGTGGMVDSSGRALFKLKKGASYIVGGYAPGMPLQERKVYIDGSGDIFVDGSLVGVDVVPLNINKPGMKISGYIRYSDGSPADSVPVVARRNGSDTGTSLPCITDSSGKYTLWVTPGNWKVEVFDPRSGVQVVTGNADTTLSNAVASLTLQNPEYSVVTGSVIESGSPVPGAMVWAQSMNREFLGQTRSGPDGKYSLSINSLKTYGATIHCFVPGFGELSPGVYEDKVDFTTVMTELTIDFGRPVSGYASVYQVGSQVNGFSNSKEMSNVSRLTFKAPYGQYTVDCYINGIGHIIREGVDTPGILNLTEDVKVDKTVKFNVAVTGGANNAWVSIMDIVSSRKIAAGKVTSDDVASFTLPKDIEVNISVFKDGRFPTSGVFRTGMSDVNVNTDWLNSGKTVTVNLAGRGVYSGNDYLIWARNIETGIVVSTRSSTANMEMKLPDYDNWLFKASADGYISDEQSISTSGGSKTVTLQLNTLVPGKASVQVVNTAQGGVVTNVGLGIKLLIPPSVMDSVNSNVSVMTSAVSKSFMDTSSVKVLSVPRRVFAADSWGNAITSLKKPLEIILDYNNEYLSWDPGKRDIYTRHAQLAYWDAAVEDWVVLPSVNDSKSHTIRGYTTHLSKFALVSPQSLSRGGTASSGLGTAAYSATGMVDQPTLDSALDNANYTGKVFLYAPSAGSVLAFTPEQLDKMIAADRPVELKISGITLDLNAESIKVDGIVGYISLGVERLTLKDYKELVSKAVNRSKYNILGDIYNFSFKSLRNDKSEYVINSFKGAVRISMPVPASARDAAINGKLLLGRFNDKTREWEAMTGRYNPSAGTFQFDTDVFSYWVLMTEK